MQDSTRPCAHCEGEFVKSGKPYSMASTYCPLCARAYRVAYRTGRADEWHGERVTKCHCGNPLPTGYSKYCSVGCGGSGGRQPTATRHQFTCGASDCSNLCESSREVARFCSDRCRDYTKTKSRAPRSQVTYGVCACGKAFGGRYREKWCPAHRGVMSLPLLGPSLEDWPEFLPTRAPRSSTAGSVLCRSCDRIVERCGRSASFCSETCQNIHRGVMAPECPLEFATCPDPGCGNLYVFDARKNRPAGCCPTHATRVRRRLRKRAERARKRNQIHEPYTLREIAERDGWRCHLCGCKVPDRPYTAHDKDATIDHLIPQSVGGDDVKSNVALAHNRCNWERGNKGLAQLRLEVDA